MFNLLEKFRSQKPEPVYVPPLTVTEGLEINGVIFPKNIQGFINFDYKIFAEIPWQVTRSVFDRKTVTWFMGKKLGTKDEPYTRTHKINKVHNYWKKLGYLPCYLRTAYLNFPEESPPMRYPDKEMWPPLPPRQGTDDQYIPLPYGRVAINEYCKPIISEKNIYIHELYVWPTDDSKAIRFYPHLDLLVPFSNCF